MTDFQVSENILCTSSEESGGFDIGNHPGGWDNDGSNQIKIGLNNNFGVTDLKYERNYEVTGLEYGNSGH